MVVDDSTISEIGQVASAVAGDLKASSGSGGQPPNDGVNLSKKTLVGGALLLLVVGVAFGRFGLPAKVVTKVVTQTVTQTVVKTVVQKASVDKKNTVTTITETTNKDGSKVKTTVISNKDLISVNTNKNVDSNTNTKTDTTMTQTVTNDKNNWIISGLAGVSNPLNGRSPVAYGAEVQRRILGPIYVNGFGLSNQTFGVGIGLAL